MINCISFWILDCSAWVPHTDVYVWKRQERTKNNYSSNQATKTAHKWCTFSWLIFNNSRGDGSNRIIRRSPNRNRSFTRRWVITSHLIQPVSQPTTNQTRRNPSKQSMMNKKVELTCKKQHPETVCWRSCFRKCLCARIFEALYAYVYVVEVVFVLIKVCLNERKNLRTILLDKLIEHYPPLFCENVSICYTLTGTRCSHEWWFMSVLY